MSATSFTFLSVNEPIVANPCALPTSCPTANPVAVLCLTTNCSSNVFQPCIGPPDSVTVPVACVPPEPDDIAIVGAVVYPEPGLVTVNADITSPVTVAVNANPVPFVPVFVTVTVGVRPVYPVPASVRVGVNPINSGPGVQLIVEPVLNELKLI